MMSASLVEWDVGRIQLSFMDGDSYWIWAQDIMRRCQLLRRALGRVSVTGEIRRSGKLANHLRRHKNVILLVVNGG